MRQETKRLIQRLKKSAAALKAARNLIETLAGDVKLTEEQSVLDQIDRALSTEQPAGTGLEREVLEAARRWYRARHHGTKDEIEIQDECLAVAVAALSTVSSREGKR